MAKIGIIEDEKNISDMIKYNLEKEGYEVYTAYDGQEGLKLIETQPLDLLLLDIMLPNVDGLDICKRVRQKMETPIMIISAKADEFKGKWNDFASEKFPVYEKSFRSQVNILETAIKSYQQAEQ